MDVDRDSQSRALAADPADVVALQYLGLFARSDGDGLQAIRQFHRAARIHGNQDILNDQIGGALPVAFHQASVLLEENRVDEAGEALLWLGRIVGAHPDVDRLLGIVRLIQGRDTEARLLHSRSPDAVTGFATAVKALDAHQRDYDFLGTVVIPAYGMQASIERALDSVVAAMDHYRTASGDGAAKIHISVVDDCSPDDTVGVVLRWARAHPDQSVALIANNQNRGAGRSRNAGAAAAFGRYLWFLDADDYFFERHFFITAPLLDLHPDLGYVRTGMYFDGIDHAITPDWREASESTYPCNLCVRRSCHDLIGGFPEQAPFNPAGPEDVAYARALHSLFFGFKLEEQTVHYTMRSGNVLSKLQKDMTGGRPPSAGGPVDDRFMAVEIIIRRWLYALEAKRGGQWDGPPMRPPSTDHHTLQSGGILARAKALMGQGKLDDAEAAYRRLAALAPDNFLAYHGLADVARARRQPEAAERFLRRVILMSANNAQAALELAEIFMGRGMFAMAAAMLGRVAAACPDDARIAVALGVARGRAGDVDGGIAALSAAVVLAPENAQAWFELGIIGHMNGRSSEALRGFGTVVRLLPDNAAAQFNLGSALFDAGDDDGADGALRKALALDPAHANALFMSGKLARRNGRREAARVLIAWAMRVDPARAEFNAEYSSIALELGDGAAAWRYGRRAVLSAPDHYEGHAALSAALERQGRLDQALVEVERAIRCNAGFGEAFTRRSMLLLARQWGAAPVRPPGASGHRRITATTLGLNGRFGNQLLQYGLLRLYAECHGLDLEVPAWLGRYLYDLDDPLPGTPLPCLPEHRMDLVAGLAGESGADYAGYDIAGYFCGDTGRFAAFKDRFRRIFRPGRHLAAHADGVAERLRGTGGTVVAIHLRRGDYGWGRFWISPEEWYLQWLDGIWADLDRPVLYLATDDPDCVKAFAAYAPLTAGDLADPIAGIEFFTDFHALCVADVVAISNSTFSFTATMLNDRCRRFFRPAKTQNALVPYDPWAADVLL